MWVAFATHIFSATNINVFAIFLDRNFNVSTMLTTSLSFEHWLIELGFNDTSTLVGHFVLFPREREKRDKSDSRGDERKGQGRKENEWKWRNRRNKNIPPLPLPAAKIAGFAQL